MGRGDRLLESLELAGRERLPGIKTTFLLTTRTMDWFAQRGYMPVGAAHERCSALLSRRMERSRGCVYMLHTAVCVSAELMCIPPLPPPRSVVGGVFRHRRVR